MCRRCRRAFGEDDPEDRATLARPRAGVRVDALNAFDQRRELTAILINALDVGVGVAQRVEVGDHVVH